MKASFPPFASCFPPWSGFASPALICDQRATGAWLGALVVRICLRLLDRTAKQHENRTTIKKSLLPNGSRSTAPASGRIGRAHKRRRRRLRARNFANCRPKPALAARQKRGAVGSMRQRVFEQFICSNTTMPNCGQGVERTARRMRGKVRPHYIGKRQPPTAALRLRKETFLSFPPFLELPAFLSHPPLYRPSCPASAASFP